MNLKDKKKEEKELKNLTIKLLNLLKIYLIIKHLKKKFIC